MTVSVSLSVCLPVRQFFCVSVREDISGTTRPIVTNFYECYLRPLLGHSLAALRYVMYFRFYG